MRDRERGLRLEVLFRQHSSAVRAYAFRRADPPSADEAVSEVFVIAWRRLEDVPAQALPWPLACARRVLAGGGRDAARRVLLHVAVALAMGMAVLALHATKTLAYEWRSSQIRAWRIYRG